MSFQYTKRLAWVSYSWVNRFIFLLSVFLTGVCGDLRAGRIETLDFSTNTMWQSQVRIHLPDSKVSGLLVFIPPGPVDSFADAGFPKILASNGVATMFASARKDGLFTGNQVLAELHKLIHAVVSKHQISQSKLALGGFSSGGIGAIRYAQYCMSHTNLSRPAAVFAVDSPLDYERWYRAAELYLQRLALAGKDLKEDRNVTNDLQKAFGGSPDQALGNYRSKSPVTVLLPDGGNAKLLRNMPVRFYIEPAVKWRLDNWDRDAYSFNLLDGTVFINVLRLLGNKQAELLTTEEKGFRPGGVRNPHSWSIVDEEDLANWLFKILRT